jgi:Ca2+-binding RTX toxin-like protein
MAFIVNPSDDNDTLHGDHAADAFVDGNAGTTASYSASSSSLNPSLLSRGEAQGATLVNLATITGTPFDDVLNGDGSANTIFGLGGNDTINAGGGADVVNGGSGNDRIIDSDFVNFDFYDGDAGIDTIDYSNVTFDDGLVTINLAVGQVFVFAGNAETIANFENVEGSQGGETIIGSDGTNVLDGNGGNDTLNGGAGNDVINGGSGADHIIDDDFVGFDTYDGGSGLDTIDYSNVKLADGVVTINLALGQTSVSGTNGQTLTDTFVNIENVIGTQNGDFIVGDANNNVLQGGDGNDTLRGGVGGDALDGGNGIDTASYVTSTSGVAVILLTGSGTRGDADEDTLVNIENLTGSSFNDTLLGNGDANTILGLDGNDTINAGSGVDSVDGGSGNDHIEDDDSVNFDVYDGGSGIDTIDYSDDKFTDGTVTINLATGQTIALGGNTETILNFESVEGSQGGETIVGSAVANILDGNGGNDVINGGAGDDTLSGGTGDDILDGGTGADVMFGGVGDDMFVVDNAADEVHESIGAGTDIVSAKVNYALQAGQEVEILRADVGVTTGLVLTGNEFDNRITGGDGNDMLNGGAGDDFLDGDAGADVMSGGVGNDTYIVDNAADRVNEGVGAGTDTVLASVNYALQAGQEVEVLRADVVGATGLVLTGNEFANSILGGAGNDTVTGGRGDDTALLGAGNDAFFWNPGDGNDTVEGQDGLDGLVFNGANVNENIDISANGSRVRFFRDVANVTMDLNGIEGIRFEALGGVDNIVINDVSGTDLIGAGVAVDLEGAIGSGVGDGAVDTVTISGTAGNDAITVNLLSNGAISVAGTATSARIFHAEASDQLVINGGASDDLIDASGLPAAHISLTLNGGAGADMLIGSQGNDFVNGGTGDDVASLGAGNDVFVWNPGDGNDTVEGQAGLDGLIFNGASIDENIDISANGGRGRFFRDVANVTMDLNGVEGIKFEALGGADHIVINDMSGTDLVGAGVAVDLEGAIGSGVGDGAVDSVTVNDTPGNDAITVNTISNGAISVSGTSASVRVFHAEATDQLVVNGGAGDDTINASALPAGRVTLTLDGGAGNDTLTGSAGNDALIGGAGLDHFFGGAGQDTFVFTGASLAALDTGVGANRDVIQDFSGDIIDLHLIDANLGVGGDQAFSFIGTNAFTAAGQVRFFADGAGNTIVEGNVDNNLGADFQIELHAFAAQLQAGNFVL